MAAGLRCGGCRFRASSSGGRWRWCGGMLRSAVRVASGFPWGRSMTSLPLSRPSGGADVEDGAEAHTLG